MREEKFMVYGTYGNEELMKSMVMLMEQDTYTRVGREENRVKAYHCMHDLIKLAGTYGFYGNLWHCYLTNLMVNDENSYSCGCESVGDIKGSINAAALHDMEIFKELFDYRFDDMFEQLRVDEWQLVKKYEPSARDGIVYNQRISKAIAELAEKLGKTESAMEMKDTITAFYKEHGVGKFGLHKSFRVRDDGNGNEKAEIEPILRIAHVSLDDIVGYEDAKKKLIENTEAFVAGKKANNCLLFGDAGTGKSSCIKAIANQYYDKGLRFIELYKHQLQYLNDIVAQIKYRNYKYIIYMDDLSFEENETEYKYLKALIEGGLEKRPDNILIYATSNRRHLVKETFADKEDIREDMHTSDTVQEKLSLAYRFGVTIYFGAPDKKKFDKIVTELAKKNNIKMPEKELLEEANKWELAHSGLSGRTAQQFIDHLLGTQGGEDGK